MSAVSSLPIMEESMRWFGPADTVSLHEIRQSGATAVFSSLHQVPYGDVWPVELIAERKKEIEGAGLRWTAVESVPVHESIKTRTGDFQRCIENYKTTLTRLGAAGIEVVVYNFMPVLDWVRTDLHYRLPDGAEALLYDPVKFAAFDLFALAREGAKKDFSPEQQAAASQYWASLGTVGQEQFTRQTLDLFPGVKLNMSIEGLRALLANYAKIDAAKLKEHLALFLKEIVPVAAAAGVRLAIHPDDPPFPVVGLPRIVSTEQDMADILAMHPDNANGLCYCTGSLGARLDNDLPAMARRFAHRINAVHLRNVAHTNGGVFYEGTHLGGNTDMYEVVLALVEEQHRRQEAGRKDWQVAFRPDHGHKILDDFKRPEPTCPGYPLIGRMRGLAEIRGVQYAVAKALTRKR